jgi:hypothetical protein
MYPFLRPPNPNPPPFVYPAPDIYLPRLSPDCPKLSPPEVISPVLTANDVDLADAQI